MSVFRGTSATQDARYADKEKKLLATTSFPVHYSTKVSVKKVNLQVLRPWISQKLGALLGFEDEVVIEYVYSLLEEQGPLDPRRMQIKLTGFLEDKTPSFMSELWALMVSAQESLGGIPKAFLDEKKAEILAKKAEQERMADTQASKLGEREANGERMSRNDSSPTHKEMGRDREEDSTHVRRERDSSRERRRDPDRRSRRDSSRERRRDERRGDSSRERRRDERRGDSSRERRRDSSRDRRRRAPRRGDDERRRDDDRRTDTERRRSRSRSRSRSPDRYGRDRPREESRRRNESKEREDRKHSERRHERRPSSS